MTERLPAAWSVGVGGLLAAALVALGGARLHWVDRTYGSYTRCAGCLDTGVLGHDLALAAALFLLIAVATLTTRRGLRLPLAALAGLLVAAYAIDVVVFRLLSQRLLLGDFLKFARELRGSYSVATSMLSERNDVLLLAVAVLAPIAAFALAMIAPATRRARLALLAAAAACAVAAWRLPDPAYFLRESYRNVLEVNRPSGVDRSYSPEFVARAHASAPLPESCSPGAARRKDIVVIVVESLSAYHSRLISGLTDSTPRLDALAQAQGTAFANFFANGFHTDGGLISVFAGRVPLPAIHRYKSLDAFAGFDRAADDFYGRLRELGYHSAFLTTASLSFLGMDRWSRAIGFDYAEGGEGAFYSGLEKGQFGAAEDAALFDRVLKYVDERDRAKPLFLGVLTVSLHPPFSVPHEQRQDEMAVARYVDAELARLYEALQERGFFSDGLLLIVGDHRSMTPLKPGEFDRYGASAFARIAAYAFGAEALPRGVETRPFQQTDVLPSLLALIDGRACRTPLQGNFLAAPLTSARHVLHVSGYEREQVQLIADGPGAAIVLDGDATHWIGAAPQDAAAVLAAVNRDRVERGAVAEDAFDFMIDLVVGSPGPR